MACCVLTFFGVFTSVQVQNISNKNSDKTIGHRTSQPTRAALRSRSTLPKCHVSQDIFLQSLQWLIRTIFGQTLNYVDSSFELPLDSVLHVDVFVNVRCRCSWRVWTDGDTRSFHFNPQIHEMQKLAWSPSTKIRICWSFCFLHFWQNIKNHAMH